MQKKVFALVYLAITLIILAAAVVVLKDRSSLPATEAEYEAVMEKALRPWDGVKEIAGTANLLLRPVMSAVDGETVVRTEGNYLLPFHSGISFDTDLAVRKVGELRDRCAEQGIPVLFVSFPSKATYTEHSAEEYGIRSDDAQTRARLLEGIRALGIPTLDMAGVLKDQGRTEEEVFYRTDHHWRTWAGLFAARATAKFLRDETSAETHPELLEEERFHMTAFPYGWLGETGRKVSATWAGTLDDYLLYEPDDDTVFDYAVLSAKTETEGFFSDFIDEDLLSGKPDLYSDSYHYAYMKDVGAITRLRNETGSGANILMIRDSYAIPVAPFLAMATGELTCWDMRKNSEKLFSYIDRHSFDAVVIAYTDLWRDEMYDFR